MVCGKIHYVGVSNVTGWQFQRIIDMSRELGLNQIVSNQVREGGREGGRKGGREGGKEGGREKGRD